MLKKVNAKRPAELFNFGNVKTNKFTSRIDNKLNVGIAAFGAALTKLLQSNQAPAALANLLKEAVIVDDWVCLLANDKVTKGQLAAAEDWLNKSSFLFTDKPYKWGSFGPRKLFLVENKDGKLTKRAYVAIGRQSCLGRKVWSKLPPKRGKISIR